MLSILLVDDEVDALEVMRLQLQAHFSNRATWDSFQMPQAALAAAQKRDYDLALLDIHLHKGADGLQLGASFMHTKTKVVFTTAHEKYALEAFKVRAFDYLLKPIDLDELTHVIDEIELLKKPANENKVLLSDHRQRLFVNESNILKAEGDGSHTKVTLTDGRSIYLSRNLNALEKRLQTGIFQRCHQSHLINLNEVRGLKKHDHYFAELKDGTLIPIARRRKKELEEKLANR